MTLMALKAQIDFRREFIEMNDWSGVRRVALVGGVGHLAVVFDRMPDQWHCSLPRTVREIRFWILTLPNSAELLLVRDAAYIRLMA